AFFVFAANSSSSLFSQSFIDSLGVASNAITIGRIVVGRSDEIAETVVRDPTLQPSLERVLQASANGSDSESSKRADPSKSPSGPNDDFDAVRCIVGTLLAVVVDLLINGTLHVLRLDTGIVGPLVFGVSGGAAVLFYAYACRGRWE